MCVHLQMPVLVSLNCIQIRIHSCMYSCIYKLLFLGFVLNQHLICLCICMYVYTHLCHTLKKNSLYPVLLLNIVLSWILSICSTLQHTATHCNSATHCNTLQHTATHCNTLQHTATHCSTHSLYTILFIKLLFPSVHMCTVYIYRHLSINIVSFWNFVLYSKRTMPAYK